ncbi:unnamed protein product [Hermetia illucens]|uniref:Zinc finger double-stranded RNA binding domain-containing protein n=1 Tax=Hermetia illucens TaxID=343691 RepID=A0A7R8YZR1_HERIL|nr:unnamed protein product [Hermetia illucens]
MSPLIDELISNNEFPTNNPIFLNSNIHKQIDDLLSASKYPIVVGGTNYYIESLLWDILVSPPTSVTSSASSKMVKDSLKSRSGSSSPEMMQREDDRDGDSSTPSDEISDLELETMSPKELHDRLRQVDPISAGRLHPNNKRKILRALEVYQETGIPISEFIKEQRSQPGGNRLGGPLRYPHTILLWLRCNQEVLNERLDKRVDSMLHNGLLPEVRNFYETYVKSQSANQYTKGILQSIGFKEFVPYLEKFGADQDTIIDNFLQNIEYKLPKEPIASEPEGLDLLRKCLDELKLVTRRYSKKQIKWIQNRFLGSHDRQVPPLYSLDTSDVSQWMANVYSPAVDIIESYINERQPKTTPMESVQHPGSGLNEEVLNFCEICKRHFVGEFQWKLHLASNKHKRAKDGLRKRVKRLGGGTIGGRGDVDGSSAKK